MDNPLPKWLPRTLIPAYLVVMLAFSVAEINDARK